MSRATTTPSWPPAPARGQRLRLTGCLALVALPHLFHLPPWVSAIAAVLLVWQAQAAWRSRPLPGRLTRFALAAAALGSVLAGFGRISGQEAGVSLLVMLLALKLCEIRSHRDAMVFLSLTAFLLVTQFLFSQSLAMAVYLVIGTWLITAAFIDVSSEIAPAGAFTDSARLLLQALPVAALLFVLFPRVPGPLWGLPSDAGARATTGLSERMSPGSISSLATSDAVALRVRFPAGDMPPAPARYWRGPVFWDLDDGTWRGNPAAEALPAPDIRPADDSIVHADITLEATRHPWLIALDMPLDTDHRSRTGAGATLHAEDDIDERIRYRARSTLAYRLDPQLDAAARERATRLPANGNPEARATARRWRAQAETPQGIVDRALTHFRERPFHYTLSPARTGRDSSIDDFLFDTREGFCEHYAGAFTFLMRAAGVPARVVTGYQGGERALVGDYWVVRNTDAHAWSEVWLADRGWVRVDPTAAVAPGRIDAGVAGSLSDSEALPYMARADGGAWYRMQMLWDGVNAAWNRWFLAYGPQQQQRLLDRIGLGGLRGTLVALTFGVAALLALLSLWLGWRMRRRRAADPVTRQWQRVCDRLAALGHPRARHEGPQAYGARVARARPDLADELDAIVAGYIRLCYAANPGSTDTRAFVARAAAFDPRRPRKPRD